MGIVWPENKLFAFTIFDDTDLATEDNVRRVYDLLEDLGFRTTKSVWPLGGTERSAPWGSTCEDPRYLEWIYRLRDAGFEIGYHLAAHRSSTRSETLRGIERFRELFGQDPWIMANHADCVESMYWGNSRLTGMNEAMYNVLTRFHNRDRFKGHVEGDPHFWGDICRDRIRYVRNFVFSGIDTLEACPFMPYHDANRPYVRYWFASSEGADIRSFIRTISERNQDRLERRGGCCIMYTHFAKGFCVDGAVDARFAKLMRRLSAMNGWFAPVSTVLDHIASARGPRTITADERRTLERRWLWHKAFLGTT